MKKYFQIILGILSFILILATSCSTDNLKIENIGSNNKTTRQETYSKINFQHQYMINFAVVIVKDKSGKYSNKTKEDAIVFLGNFRSREAIVPLIENIRFKSNEAVRPAGDLGYPCINALTNIGIPAIDPILENVRKNNNIHDDELGLYSIVIFYIFGRDIGKIYISQEMKKVSSQTEKLNLEHFIELFETIGWK